MEDDLEQQETIKFVDLSQPRRRPDEGTAGLHTQMGGCAVTVSQAAAATGGIRPGGLIEADTE